MEVRLDGISPSSSGRSVDLFQQVVNPWYRGRMACGGDVRTTVDGVVVGAMLPLDHWYDHGYFDR